MRAAASWSGLPPPPYLAIFGTLPSSFTMKCVRQRCNDAPERHRATVSFEHRWASEVTSTTHASLRAKRERRDASQNQWSSLLPFCDYEPLATLAFHHRGYHQAYIDDATSLPHHLGQRTCLGGSVRISIGGPCRKRLHEIVYLLANPAHFVLRGALEASGLTSSSTRRVDTPSTYAWRTIDTGAHSLGRRDSSRLG